MGEALREETIWRLDLGYVNAYLIDDDGTLTLIDAGTPRGLDTIRDEFADIGIEESEIDRILITHFDPDHVGTIAHLDTDAPIYARDPDASYLDGSTKPSLFNRKGFMHRLGNLFLTFPDREINRIEEKVIGGFQAIHTPGHTDGHVVFHHADQNVLFVGDLLGEDNGLTMPPSIMTKHPAVDKESIKTLVGRDLDFDIIGMGHGDPVTTDAEQRLATFAKQL